MNPKTAMTNAMNKPGQSCTVSDTPETDAILKQFEHLLPNWLASEMAGVARKLERERDAYEKERNEARAELVSRIEQLSVKQLQLSELRKQLAEAVNSCNIWQKGHSELVADRDRWISRADAHKQDYEQMLKRIDVVADDRALYFKYFLQEREKNKVQEKMISKLLTTLQENGIEEYEN